MVVRWRTGLIGAGLDALAYLVLQVVVLPALLPALLDLDAQAAALLILGGQLVILLLAGYLTARLHRRAHPTDTRARMLSTVVAGGGVAAVVVLLLGSAAAAATAGEPLGLGAIVLTSLVFLVVPALASLLVRVRSGVSGYLDQAHQPLLTGERGAASLESLGVTVVAALLVSALLLVMTPAGTWLSDNLRVNLCRLVSLGDGDCGTAARSEASEHAPDEPCVMTDSADSRTFAGSVMFVAVEGGGVIRVESMSDETYRVSMEGVTGVGVTDGLGGGVSVTVDDMIHGAEAQASATAYAVAGVGSTWVVDEQGKEQLVGYLQDERNWATFKSAMAGGGVAGSAVSGLADAGRSVWDYLEGDDYVPSEPDEVYGYAGATGEGTASGASVVQGGSLSGSVSNVLGSRLDNATGAITFYYKMTDEAAASLTQQDGITTAAGQASGTLSMMLAVTVDPEGNPLTVSAQAMAVGDASAQADVLFAGTVLDESPSGGRLYNATVEVTGPETKRIVGDLLVAAGLAGKDPVRRVNGLTDAATTFMAAARDRGVLTRQDVESGSTTSLGIQAGGAIGPVSLGGSFSNGTSTITSGDAAYYDGSAWVPWTDCAS